MKVKNLISYWLLFWNSLAIGYLFMVYTLTGEVPFLENNPIIAYLELALCIIFMILGLTWFITELKRRVQI